MSSTRLHADEIDIDAGLVQRLVASQFPQWAHLPLEHVPSAGTDNVLYRLGSEMVVRMPRYPAATGQVEKEFRWLPHFAPHLPLAISEPLVAGEPVDEFPYVWSIYRWLDGVNATFDQLADPAQAARDLAGFVRALWAIDTTGGPEPGASTSGRGVPLAERDDYTRTAIGDCTGMIDTDAAAAAWDVALDAPVWDQPGVWVHGDIQSGNLLAVDGRITAVIDFGCLAIGDPAVDLIVAWNLLDRESRAVFRESVAVDDATWQRGAGWVLSVSVVALPYYHITNPVLAGISRYAIDQVLSDDSWR